MSQDQIIIGLIGEPGSGKDTVADYIQEKYGAKLLSFSGILNEVLNIFFDVVSREDQQWLSYSLRTKFGKDIFEKAIKKRIVAEDKIAIINGIRLRENYDFIRSFPKNYLIYVTADPKLRWERMLSRGEKTSDKVSFEKFLELEKLETEIQIPEIGAKADFTIRNEKDLDYLLSETDKIMEQILK